jgi:hypothetical protein
MDGDQAIKIMTEATAEALEEQGHAVRQALEDAKALLIARIAELETRLAELAAARGADADFAAAERRALEDHLAAAEATTAMLVDVKLSKAISELPAPRDGQDGTDRILALPRTVREDEACEHNAIVHHRFGLWQAVRATSGDPDTDPAGWKCLVPGVAGIETREDYARREMIAGFRMSDGRLHECRWRMPATYLPHDYRQRGWGVIAGDILRDGDHDHVALVDNPAPPAGENSDQWQKLQVIGRRGRPGESVKGEPGPPGPGLEGLAIVRDPASDRLAILPEYADKRIPAVPIAIDLMTEPLAQGRAAIVGFAGAFHSSKRYARGDVVSAFQGDAAGLWLSLRPDNQAPLHDGAAWQRMI